MNIRFLYAADEFAGEVNCPIVPAKGSRIYVQNKFIGVVISDPEFHYSDQELVEIVLYLEH